MAEPALRLCADAGLAFEVTERSLVVPCANAPVDLLLVRPSDIPEYAAGRGGRPRHHRARTSSAEAEAEVVTLAELGFARCSLDAAVPVDARHSASPTSTASRVATAYPVSTRRLLVERGVECELIPVSGSVEATPRLGLADAIVDLVSTGSTMTANGLRPIGRCSTSQAVLVGGRAAVEARREARRAARADALRRRGGSAAPLRDDERPRRRPPCDPCGLTGDGRAVRAAARGRGRDRGARRGRGRRDLEPAPGAASGRARRRSWSCRSSGWWHGGGRSTRRSRRRADRRRRARARRRGAARVDLAPRRAETGRVRVPAERWRLRGSTTTSRGDPAG